MAIDIGKSQIGAQSEAQFITIENDGVLAVALQLGKKGACQRGFSGAGQARDPDAKRKRLNPISVSQNMSFSLVCVAGLIEKYFAREALAVC